MRACWRAGGETGGDVAGRVSAATSLLDFQKPLKGPCAWFVTTERVGTLARDSVTIN